MKVQVTIKINPSATAEIIKRNLIDRITADLEKFKIVRQRNAVQLIQHSEQSWIEVNIERRWHDDHAMVLKMIDEAVQASGVATSETQGQAVITPQVQAQLTQVKA